MKLFGSNKVKGDTREGQSMFYHMRQVKINRLDMGVFGCDYAKGGSDTHRPHA